MLSRPCCFNITPTNNGRTERNRIWPPQQTEEPMRNVSKSKQVFAVALVLGSLGIGILMVGVSEAQTDNLLDRRLEVVLLDCGEAATTFVVERISQTLDVNINPGLDCAEAVQKLLSSGFVLGPGAGGATARDSASLDHFLLIFVLDRNALIDQRRSPIPLNPDRTRDCVLEQNLRDCPPPLPTNGTVNPTLNRPLPVTPILPIPEPLAPIIQRQEPLTPILQPRTPLPQPGRPPLPRPGR